MSQCSLDPRPNPSSRVGSGVQTISNVLRGRCLPMFYQKLAWGGVEGWMFVQFYALKWGLVYQLQTTCILHIYETALFWTSGNQYWPIKHYLCNCANSTSYTRSTTYLDYFQIEMQWDMNSFSISPFRLVYMLRTCLWTSVMAECSSDCWRSSRGTRLAMLAEGDSASTRSRMLAEPSASYSRRKCVVCM